LAPRPVWDSCVPLSLMLTPLPPPLPCVLPSLRVLRPTHAHFDQVPLLHWMTSRFLELSFLDLTRRNFHDFSGSPPAFLRISSLFFFVRPCLYSAWDKKSVSKVEHLPFFSSISFRPSSPFSFLSSRLGTNPFIVLSPLFSVPPRPFPALRPTGLTKRFDLNCSCAAPSRGPRGQTPDFFFLPQTGRTSHLGDTQQIAFFDLPQEDSIYFPFLRELFIRTKLPPSRASVLFPDSALPIHLRVERVNSGGDKSFLL